MNSTKKLLWFRNKTPETVILESLRKYYQTISSSLPRLDWTARILSVIFYNFFQFLHPFIILKRKNKSLQIFVILLLNFLIVISLTAFATVCNIKYCTSYWHKLRKVWKKRTIFWVDIFQVFFPQLLTYLILTSKNNFLGWQSQRQPLYLFGQKCLSLHFLGWSGFRIKLIFMILHIMLITI